MTPVRSRPGRGLVVSPSVQSLGPRRCVGAARAAAGAGFDSLWTVEGRGMAAAAYLGAAATAAPGIALGTGVLPTPLHFPTAAAMAVATLQALVPARTVWVGLGVSTPVVAGAWHGARYPDRPLAALREYVTVLRGALSGEVVDHEGTYHTVRGFRLEPALVPAAPPPIVLGALNRRMQELAGAIADGVLLNAVPVSAAGPIAEQARAAGNRTVFAFVHASVAPVALGRRSVRRTIAAEASADGYARLFTRAGYGDAVAEVRRRQAAGDRWGACEAVPDELCDDLVAFGSATAVAERLRAFEAAGIVPLLSPELVSEDPAGELARTLAAAAPPPRLTAPPTTNRS